VSDLLEHEVGGPRIVDLDVAPLPAVPLHLSMALARKVAALKRARILAVECEGRLVGLLDERALTESDDEREVAAAMKPLSVWLEANTPASRARDLFVRSGVAALPVLAGGFVLGVMSRAVVERALAHRSVLPATTRAVRGRAAA
jgi:CBS domain-containing protein